MATTTTSAPSPSRPPFPSSDLDDAEDARLLVSLALSALSSSSVVAGGGRAAELLSSLDAASSRDAERLAECRRISKEAEEIAKKALSAVDGEEREERERRGDVDVDAEPTAPSTLLSAATAALDDATRRLRDADAADVSCLSERARELERLHSEAAELVLCGRSPPSSSSSPSSLIDSTCLDLEERLRQSRRRLSLRYLSRISAAESRRELAERSLAEAARASAALYPPLAVSASREAEAKAEEEIGSLYKRAKELRIHASAARAAFAKNKAASEREACALRAAAEADERAEAAAKAEADRNAKQLRELSAANKTREAVEAARLDRVELELRRSEERRGAAAEARLVAAASLADETKKIAAMREEDLRALRARAEAALGGEREGEEEEEEKE